jgi:hemerythrin-like domain-containing protein
MTHPGDEPATATGILRREHELILAVADVLERLVDRVGEGSELDRDVAVRCVSFIRLYADLCHHGKEESLLFPELEQHGLPSDQGPIAVMLQEHEMGRGLVREMSGALAGTTSGDDTTSVFTAAALSYVDLIRDHISKENTILFEMADNIVVGDDCRALCDRYVDVDLRLFGERSKPELEQMAADLAEI